jgi:hypothetical protein
MTSDGRSPANSLCNGMASISARRRCATGWRKQGYGGVQPRKLGQAHSWGPRRSGFGEFVQWDTSTHAWLEGQGEAVRYLVRMIGNATCCTTEHARTWGAVGVFGAPRADRGCTTDRAGSSRRQREASEARSSGWKQIG